jgi:hypothetical protein
MKHLEGFWEPGRLATLANHILVQAPQKANLRTLSSEEVLRILIDQQVFKLSRKRHNLRHSEMCATLVSRIHK